jgi:hypothetical protein
VGINGWGVKHTAQAQLYLHSSDVFMGWDKIRCNSALKTKVAILFVNLAITYKTI